MMKYLILILLPFLLQAQSLLILMDDNAVVFCEGNLTVNGQFTDWTADDPDNWVTVEDANNYVTENPAGVAEIHVEDGGTVLQQVVFEIGLSYNYSFDVLEYSGSRVNVNMGGNWVEGGNQLTTGTYTGTVTATEVHLYFATWSGVAMMQVDNICITVAP